MVDEKLFNELHIAWELSVMCQFEALASQQLV
jgi:hypothetical protein